MSAEERDCVRLDELEERADALSADRRKRLTALAIAIIESGSLGVAIGLLDEAEEATVEGAASLCEAVRVRTWSPDECAWQIRDHHARDILLPEMAWQTGAVQ